MVHDKVLTRSQSTADLERGDEPISGTPPCPPSCMTCVCHALHASRIHATGAMADSLGGVVPIVAHPGSRGVLVFVFLLVNQQSCQMAIVGDRAVEPPLALDSRPSSS
jgi:hypothetical protein